MRWFYNMKIGAKLIVSFILVAIVAGVVGIIGIYNINILNKNDKSLYTNMTVPLSQTSELAKLFQSVRVINRDMILETDADEINAQYGLIGGIITQMNEMSAGFESTIHADDVEVQAAYDAFMATRAVYRSYLEKLLQFCLENKDVEAYNLLKGELRVAGDNEQNAIDTLVKLKIGEAKLQSDSNTEDARSATIQMIVVVGGCMLLAILLGIFISRIIGKPIKKLSSAAELIADGDLDINLVANSRDEVGILAASFIKMADNINDVMSNINVAAEQVAAGSKQVSNSSMALSQGATEQASSVEELSSSLEEIASQTRLNADNASKANKLAETAKDKADIGNSQMKEMLKAMDEINDSSSNISKIIKVIDDIAFQTNILALNAAVEAARAGQHGKGFAVVAEEVRNLAARSAKAAKETTTMIESSIKKVDGGTKIANQTADALVQIVDNITKVATLVGNIAVASNEQASGIAQVNQGIMQVSDVVQMNSATSQESAAASEELSSQSEMLKDQVMRFKLKRRGNDSYSYNGSEKIQPDVMKMLNKMGNTSRTSSLPTGHDIAAKSNAKILLSDNEYGKY